MTSNHDSMVAALEVAENAGIQIVARCKRSLAVSSTATAFLIYAWSPLPGVTLGDPPAYLAGGIGILAMGRLTAGAMTFLRLRRRVIGLVRELEGRDTSMAEPVNRAPAPPAQAVVSHEPPVAADRERPSGPSRRSTS